MKVFVSASTGDLGRFRKAAAEQLFRLGVEAVEQTYFGVDHQKLPTLLKDKVKSCDAVICLVGGVFGAAPKGSSRSYTQMEYDFARELGKPIFLFFPSVACQLDGEGQDTPEQRELQRTHAECIRASTPIWYCFDDVTQVRLITAEAIFKISPEAAGGKIARAIRTDFPTPLAFLYDDCIGSQQQNLLRLLVAESLRFISLLALHDSAVYRILGSQSADTEEIIHVLAQPEKVSDWHSLLRLACPAEGSLRPARFINEFSGWEGRHNRTLVKLVKAEESLSQRRIPDLLQIAGSIREGMSSILADLDFLRRYILFAVVEADPQRNSYTAHILRGIASRSFEFVRDPRSPTQPLKGELYLLSIDRRRALCLSPSLSYESREGDDRVYGWAGLRAGKDSTLQLLLQPFDEHDEIKVPEQPDTRNVMTDWLGEELCQHAFGFKAPTSPIMREGKLLDDDSWESLQKVVLPAGDEPSVLGGRFRVEGSPIHRGLHADVFEATDIASEQVESDLVRKTKCVPSHPVVHVLRKDSASDEQLRTWFENRSDCWKRLDHPTITRLYELGDPGGQEGLPFLLTDRVTGSLSLERLVQSGTSLSDKILLEVMMLATDVCRVAHRQDIFLLALPLRHFLIDDRDNLNLTGFETAIHAKHGAIFSDSPMKRLRRLSKDLDIMAPELQCELGMYAPTLDVFAIGAFLARLRTLPIQPMAELSPTAWADPWRCLAFHCLAADPHIRFQSADQVLVFLKDWLVRDAPQTVAIPSQSGLTSFSIGKYALTNREYLSFCRETGRILPAHLREVGMTAQSDEANPRQRLNGPWLPVTNVDLFDAEAYCGWLSNKTGCVWRLPTEREWLMAAGSQTFQEYPWGNEGPDRFRANFDRYYRGPSVVGAFHGGRSLTDCWDMAGNVWEWCSDFVKHGAPRRVLKGGAHGFSSESLKLASGHAAIVACRSPHIGFRVLCEEKPQ